jgi:hypothetical protein
MKTRTKIWLGVGAFAFAQVAGVSLNGGVPSLTIGQEAQAADGTCGWERSSNTGRWEYDNSCERGERYNPNRPNERGGNWQRGERWNERGERFNERGERWNEQGQRWEHGERGERWGERG